MQRIIRNTLLSYIPTNLLCEKNLNPARIYDFNQKDIKKGKIIYLMEREIRPYDNFSLQFCKEVSKKMNLPYKIICSIKSSSYRPKDDFINNQIEQVMAEFLKNKIDFEIFKKDENELLEYLKKIPIALLVIDFNPILNRNYLQNVDFKVYEVDSHNIIPARFLSHNQEYGASTLRRKIYRNIASFLTKYKEESQISPVVADFIEKKLPYYEKFRNNPSVNVQSGLSKYLNLGFISAQRVVLEVISANAADINKEAFLEELIIRKELADNFCLYCKDFKSLKCIPNWAKDSLQKHKDDLREHIYSKVDLENSKTNDALWNAAQKQLIREGVIHGYLRMYWAKQFLKWTKTAQEALEIAIYLNDKYAYDAPSASGYTAILWSIGALHDRAFSSRYLTGKIRTMTYNSTSKKFDVNKYIEKYK